MPKCGDFSHDLIDSGNQITWKNTVLIRCTIISIDRRYNTVNVEVGETPPATVPAGELTDIDCTDIPVFPGDTWSADGHRRVFNNVPIHYHCQGSSGSIEELKTGNKAFKVPVVEIENPPNSQEAVKENHLNIIREKALLLYIPPSPTEKVEGKKGYRYVIGHTDRNDIAPCKSEYICLRINRKFDQRTWISDPNNPTGDQIWNENYGYVLEPDAAIIHIIDPIGRRVYNGLEEFGISFPCAASIITDKVQSITVDENTSAKDREFLDKLYLINALYEQSFILQLPYQGDNYVIPGGNIKQYEPTDNCHSTYPTKLCWLTHFFDPGLQCEISSLDPRTFREPWGTVGISHSDTTPDKRNMVQYDSRSYFRWPNGDYQAKFTTNGPFPSGLPDYSYIEKVILNVHSGNQADNNYYYHTIQETTQNNYVEMYNLKGWYVYRYNSKALETPFLMVDFTKRSEGEGGSQTPEYSFSKTTVSLAFYHPSSKAPWHTKSLSAKELNGKYSGFPNTNVGKSGFGGIGCHGEGMAVGYDSTYSFHVAIYYHDGFSYTKGLSDVSGFSTDVTHPTVKVNFSYNPNFWRGQDNCAFERRTPRACEYLAGASSFCEAEVQKMWASFVTACAAYDYWEHPTTGEHILAFPKGYFSSFVITVVE